VPCGFHRIEVRVKVPFRIVLPRDDPTSIIELEESEGVTTITDGIRPQATLHPSHSDHGLRIKTVLSGSLLNRLDSGGVSVGHLTPPPINDRI
jgi:hypothetical protein